VNLLGALAAATAFLSIWLGHVSVRRIEAASARLWIPTALFIVSAGLLEWLAASAQAMAVSTTAGILGITLLWDSLELWRQQDRVRRGHAPASPSNPRHRSMLEAWGSRATTLDLLKREPCGRAVSMEEAAAAVES
jgi:Domain of unknown function (DUF4491)